MPPDLELAEVMWCIVIARPQAEAETEAEVRDVVPAGLHTVEINDFRMPYPIEPARLGESLARERQIVYPAMAVAKNEAA